MHWAADWEFGALTIVVTTLFHTMSLVGLARLIFHERLRKYRQRSLWLSSFIFSIFALCAIVLHAVEAALWALVFMWAGAIADFPSAYLHSLGAFTTLGDPTVVVAKQWRLLNQLEALNGAVSLGLTTALLYSSARRVQKIIEGATDNGH